MKKLFALSLIISALALTGCFGGDNEAKEEKAPEGYAIYQNEDILMYAPEGWEVISADKLPSNSKQLALVAFRNNVKHPVFTANIVVFKTEVPENTVNKDFVNLIREKNGATLHSYREIASESHSVMVDGKPEETLFLYFEGKENPDRDLKEFMETSAVQGENAYFVLGSMLAGSDEGLKEKVEKTVKSIKVK